MPIQYIRGNAFEPVGVDKKFILHFGNNAVTHMARRSELVDIFNEDFELGLAAKYPETKNHYIDWCKHGANAAFGGFTMTHINEELFVFHIMTVEARELYIDESIALIRYDALIRGLAQLFDFLVSDLENRSVHIQRNNFGNWIIIEEIIRTQLTDKGAKVFIYSS